MRINRLLYGLLWFVLPLTAQNVAVSDTLKQKSDSTSYADSLTYRFTIQEVVVTAQESTHKSSTSVIQKDAMEHLQPSSFADIVSMLPGATTQDPALTSAKTIRLREANNGTASSDYATSSLGTSFVMDGAPLTTDANMQYVQSGNSNQDSKRQTVNAGVDMRSIATDDIEKVEIIRGIAGAEYGDVTGGVVHIERTARPTPWKARFKADGFSKLFYVGKGVGWNNNQTVLNASLDYLNAKADPTNSLENYQRITASARLQQRWNPGRYFVKWQTALDYTGSIDNEKQDPDIHYNKEDSYLSSYHRVAWGNTLNWQDPDQEWWKTTLTAGVSASFDLIEQTRLVQLTTPVQPAVDNMQEGNKDVPLLPAKYIARHTVDGKPVGAYLRPKAEFRFDTWQLHHEAAAGIEWSYDKNFGQGQVYDLTRPLNYTSFLRPRAYYDIPANNRLAWFVQDNIHWAMPLHFSIDLQVGLRGTSLLGLNSQYIMHGKCYLDPRLNLSLNLPAGNGTLHIAGGWGIHTKTPTLLQLYPNLIYEDLKAPDIPVSPTDTQMNIYTHIINATNYTLTPARNYKWEVRLGGDWGQHHLSITYFQERMNSGFRSSTVAAAFTYPIVHQSVAHEYTRLLTYSMTTNGSEIRKQGVEWQYQSPRIPVICTRFTVNGAWLRTRYQNAQAMFSTDRLTAVIGNTAIRDRYIGLYDWNDGSLRENLNTNLIADVHIAKIGLTVSATFELNWFTATQTLFKNGIPVAYIDYQDGQLHPYTQADQSDPWLQHLIFTYNQDSFRRQQVPFAGYLNLRVQKTITRYAHVALFVNRLLDYLPDYKVDGITIHRNVSPYFGMELNLHI